MNNVKKYNSVEEFLTDYQSAPQAFNMLVDLQSVQDISPLYRPVINLVMINTDPEERDIYLQTNATDSSARKYVAPNLHYSLTHRGLMKIRAAADAQFISTVSSTNMENKTVTATVEMKFRSPTGTWSIISDSKNRKMTFKSGGEDVDAHQKAVSGAQDRCIRKAFNIKDHYPIHQLNNPFVIMYLDLNDNIPEVREAKILAAIAPNALLYGLPSRQAQQQLPPAPVPARLIDLESGEILDGGAHQ